MKFLFCYSGLGNVGDDLMFKGLVENYTPGSYKTKKKKYKIKDEIEVEGILDLVISAIFSNEFILVGGNVFSYERPKSYFKVLFFLFIFSARKILRKSSVVDSIGLDLKEGILWRFLVRKTLSYSTDLSVRDELSYRYLRSCGLSLKYSYDRVYRERENLFNNTHIERKKNGIVWWVSYPAFRKKSNNIDSLVIKEIMSEFKPDQTIYFICQEDMDVKRALKLIDDYNVFEYEIVTYDYNNIEVFKTLLTEALLCVTERYHGAVIAESLGINWIPIPFSEKLSRLKPDEFRVKK